MLKRRINSDYLRSSLFGFEDALVSTTGMVIGISAGTADYKFIILASLVTITVEAISMGAGEFLSEEAVHEVDGTPQYQIKNIIGGIIMFLSYVIGGMIPVVPILIFSRPTSIILSISLAFLGLFILGYVKGRVVKRPPFRSAIEIFLIGGTATLIGVLVGFLFKI